MVMTSDELSPIKTGCLETPCKNSYYCEKHRSSEFSLFFNIKGERISIKIDSTPYRLLIDLVHLISYLPDI